ncbi:MAG: aldehyde dehydrogenase [Candidatus Rokuibacteriota bacterium]|nr:MAG: aldehyde dehydrogenase [Candidatus Rokubacteria bacterium]
MNASRRDFLKQSGALVVGFALVPSLGIAQEPARLPGSLQNNRRLDAWLAIEPNGRVTIFTGKIELGQGIGTALSQIAADELDVDLARLDIVHGDTARTPNEGQTAGSLSVEQSGTALRFACAEARDILVSAAAAKLGVPAADLNVSDGTVTAPGGASVTYWDLAGAADLKREASAKATPKPASGYRWVGKSVARRDIPKKFTGGAAYVQDVRLPGMVFGRVVRPPSPGARLVSVDDARVRRMPGVVAVVRDGSFLAVAAKREEQAIRARDALKRSARWKETESLPPSGDALYRHLMSAQAPAQTVADKASATAGAAVKTLDAVYTRPYQCHASIGPSCALAHWKDGALTVWTHSQGVFPLRADLAKALGVDPKQIRCIHAEGAGCYGHNGADDVALDAALLARAAGGKPVKLQWMRDDEFAWEPYGSAMVMKLAGGIDAQGQVVSWSHELWSHPHSTRPGSTPGVNLLAARHLANPLDPGLPPDVPQPSGGSDRNAIPLYDFGNVKVVKHYIPESPLRTSALRTLGGYANVFALESFVDEVALAAGVDPVEFRLRHTTDPRARAVIEAAARKAGWQPGTRGDGARGRGFAFARYKNLACYVAMAADVEVERATGRVRVTRAIAAVDAGQIVNPDGVVNQIEGGIIQSASWTLKESVRFDRTRVTTRSWADYPILRFDEVPEVDVVLVDRPGERFLGVGEGAQGPAAAAIANAVANATGKRLRDLPLTPERLKQALA